MEAAETWFQLSVHSVMYVDPFGQLVECLLVMCIQLHFKAGQT